MSASEILDDARSLHSATEAVQLSDISWLMNELDALDVPRDGVWRARIGAHIAEPTRPLARKWRRKGLKTLNPRPEMVWPQKRRTHKIWVQRCDGVASLAPPPAKLLARSRRLRPARKW
jgi:hypothetical protein